MVDKAKNLDANYKPPNFFTYFAIDCSEEMNIKELLKVLWKNKNIEYAYKESGPTDPPTVNALDDRSSRWQDYLKPAPIGIDAMFAWNMAGGDGYGTVGFIDIELGWYFEHNDLPNPPLKIISGVNLDYFSHGTGVLGIILAQDNNTGVVGITPKIDINKTGVISPARPGIGRRNVTLHTTKDDGTLVHNISEAIMDAVDTLTFGDVLLIELQVLLDVNPPMAKYPCEAEMAIFEAIRLATESGIIVIEAAGNGSRDLDSFKDDSAKFVLNRNHGDFKDSGAIMVGSASSAEPHARDSDSNYGSRIDCYAWGENIKTTGNGTATRNPTPTGYTSAFNGTSGASAIIAGAVIAIQSMREASGERRFSPKQIREILRRESNGTTSANPATDKIGLMPDLSKIYENEIR